jgi:hypothetical protein
MPTRPVEIEVEDLRRGHDDARRRRRLANANPGKSTCRSRGRETRLNRRR